MSKNRNLKRFQERKAKARAELETIGKVIAERVKKMRDYEATAQEKAGVELKNAKDQRDTITGVLLVQAKAKCNVAGESFKEFQAKYCPDLGRSRLYEILAIADGRKTREQSNADNAARQAKHQTKLKEAAAARPLVTDKPAASAEPQAPPVPVTGSASTEISKEEMCERMAKLPGAGAEPMASPPIVPAAKPTTGATSPAPKATNPQTDDLVADKDQRSRAALKKLKAAIDECLPEMNTTEKQAGFDYYKFHPKMVGVPRRAA